jgi:hypothetical protein
LLVFPTILNQGKAMLHAAPTLLKTEKEMTMMIFITAISIYVTLGLLKIANRDYKVLIK